MALSWRGFATSGDVLAQIGVAAMLEELMFRALLFRILEERAGTQWALVASALFFGVAHAANGGVGIALYLGISPQLGAVGFSLALSLLMAHVMLKREARADSIIGVLWAAGMAAGVIFADLTPGYGSDLMSYLFGSIITVPRGDLYALAGLDVVLLAAALRYYNGFVAMAFDREFAAGEIPKIPLNLTLVKGCSILGVFWGGLAPWTLMIAGGIAAIKKVPARVAVLISAAISLVVMFVWIQGYFATDQLQGTAQLLSFICVAAVAISMRGRQLRRY